MAGGGWGGGGWGGSRGRGWGAGDGGEVAGEGCLCVCVCVGWVGGGCLKLLMTWCAFEDRCCFGNSLVLLLLEQFDAVSGHILYCFADSAFLFLEQFYTVSRTVQCCFGER